MCDAHRISTGILYRKFLFFLSIALRPRALMMMMMFAHQGAGCAPSLINVPQWYIINLWCGPPPSHFFLCAAIVVIDLCALYVITWAAKTNEKMILFPSRGQGPAALWRAAAGKCLQIALDRWWFQINMLLVSKLHKFCSSNAHASEEGDLMEIVFLEIDLKYNVAVGQC